ncbi:MAG: CCA tRNA nucleotidyltransferase [Candidatus Fimenecus sp.]
MPEILAPEQVKAALRRLHESGFAAYAVGGCVRDSLLGKMPLDWDITTDARPEETERVFADCRLIETGLQHGTVTVLSDGLALEITTFRVDGDYLDARHPESVSFTRNLQEDLLRRDFTVNTLCWNEQDGVVDLCGGLSDLQNGILRAVGDPDRRFLEDALRILRGIRFASVLGFTIEEKTAESILRNRQLLSKVAAERIRVEFSKLLCGKNAAAVLDRYREVIAVFIPEVRALFDCPQNTVYHCFDVYRHTLAALEHTEPTEKLRLCMFFHDFGKPLCRKTDANATDHFKGHQKVGAELVEPILKRLRYDNSTVKTVTGWIAIHDLKSPKTKIEAKQLLSRIGEDNYRALIKIKRADCRGKAQPHAIDEKLRRMEDFLTEILDNHECYDLRGLAVNGDDLKEAGITDGKAIRDTLNGLLEEVIKEQCENERETLLARIQQTEDVENC